ncbi:aspartate/glutamate racemase family protein [Flagellimonas allohymeniacidonis]|uniref:Aspartate/glutamate racemase family protein n=1 Tax=Flagellimonas allohymeniacidonis TaxID=2517819 RepID=A0A4Q8QBM6_9FLAO|nr:aspartate/glutamate racemase family protein [Allomuricauda hymeniacidonis]TAI47772.1 aspartate/glutamate racemase family protein [Allomuricauda hymeniacidonis]
MKTIGMIGGMSWESSKIYYQHVNEMVREQLGGSHSAKSVMSSVDFEQIEKWSFSDDWGKIGQEMASQAQRLEKAGSDLILLCTNTIHLVSDHITNATRIPFLHIAEATGAAISAAGLKKVALLGTQFTMEKDFYTKILEDQFDLEVLVPESNDRKTLQAIIYNELVKGVFTEEAKKTCLGIIEKLKKHGIEGVILGCTELPILIPDEEVDLPTFDTTKIHAQKAVEFALS